MENELVKETKTICKDVYDALVKKHAKLKSRGASVGILNEIVYDINRVNEIYANVNNENAKELHDAAVELEAAVNYKYLNIDDEDEEDEKKSNAGRVIAALTGLTLLAGTAYHTGSILHSLRGNDCDKTETVEESESNVRIGDSVIDAFDKTTEESKATEETKTTEETTTEETKTTEESKTQEDTTTATETTTAEATTEETKVETPVENMLIAGEYGTFFDVNDDEQVNARAQYILDTYYAPFMNQLSENERKDLTQANIANVIRVMNGVLPVDENGNKTMDANVVDYYGQLYTVFVGDLGSSPQLGGRLYNVPAHMFAIDGGDISNFLISYDNAYQKIADGNNQAIDQRLAGEEVTGATLLRSGIADLGYKYWYEWVMQGIFGDVNPYNFFPKERLNDYLGAFAKYGQFAFEYNENAMQPVCVTVCVNYETKEMMEIPVNEIFVGYTSGVWDTVIAKAAGIPVEGTPDSIAFTQDLMDELTWQYNNLQQRSLNK